MYIDILPNDNVGEAVMATFKDVGPERPVHVVRLQLDGVWTWCAVAGWGEDGPEPARLAPIEESGDGPALVVHGGSQGLRLARIADPAQAGAVRWDLADTHQWGEGFLLVRPGTEWR